MTAIFGVQQALTGGARSVGFAVELVLRVPNQALEIDGQLDASIAVTQDLVTQDVEVLPQLGGLRIQQLAGFQTAADALRLLHTKDLDDVCQRRVQVPVCPDVHFLQNPLKAFQYAKALFSTLERISGCLSAFQYV